MTDIQCTTTQPQLIAVAKLEKSPLNARRTVRSDGITELKASILSHGLMQNLVVTATDGETYRVIAGGRRLEAIHALQAEGKLPFDFAAPCQIVTEEYALEMSLAENTIRLAMHPADQFQTFADLIDKGATAAEVAERFGVEESLVLKRMKLARVAPELFQEYRNDGMTLECLMAYTITDDHRRQRKVFKSLQDWQKDDPEVIRNALTEKMVEASSKLAQFVGLDAYHAAGGISRADLFGDEVYLEKPALLNKLAEKKLDGIRGELEAEGWNWIEINPERDWNLINRCSRIKPMLIEAPTDLIDLKSQLDSELEEIERALEVTESDELLDQQQTIRDRLDADRGTTGRVRRLRYGTEGTGRVFRVHRAGRYAVHRKGIGQAGASEATGNVAKDRARRNGICQREAEKRVQERSSVTLRKSDCELRRSRLLGIRWSLWIY